jgi:hypothetical protein
METLARIEGHRWAIEDSFETAKNELDALLLFQRDMGTYVASCQLFNNPVMEGEQTFREDWLQYWRPTPEGPVFAMLTCAPNPLLIIKSLRRNVRHNRSPQCADIYSNFHSRRYAKQINFIHQLVLFWLWLESVPPKKSLSLSL